MTGIGVPTRQELTDSTLQAIRSLGGSASIEEIAHQVIEDLKLAPEQIDSTEHMDSRGLKHELGWCRTILKKTASSSTQEEGYGL